MNPNRLNKGANKATPARQSSNQIKQSKISNPSSSAKDLINIIKSNPDCAAILLVIPDFVRRERASRFIIKNWIETAGLTVPNWILAEDQVSPRTNDSSKDESTAFSNPVSVHKYSGADLTINEIKKIKDSARSFDLFSPFQISYIKDISLCNAACSSELASCIPSFTKSHKLLVTAKDLATKHVVRSSIKEVGEVVELAELKGFELRRWLEKELKRLGLAPKDNQALERLALAGDESPDILFSMVQQLACFCMNSIFSMQDVESLFVYHTIPGEFELLDTLISGNIARTETMLSEIMRSGKNMFMLMGLLNRSFSNYLAVKNLLEEGFSPQEIRQKLGLSPWAFNKASSIIKKFNSAHFLDSLKQLVKADSRLKNKSLLPESIASDLMLNLSSLFRASKVGNKVYNRVYKGSQTLSAF